MLEITQKVGTTELRSSSHIAKSRIFGYKDDVNFRQGFQDDEKKNVLLSQETSNESPVCHALCIALILCRCCIIASFTYAIILMLYLNSIPGTPEFLSRWITQDGLEKYFGLQRQQGQVNTNPNTQQER